MKYSELERLLRETSEVYREGANHTLWKNKSTGKIFAVSRHKNQEVPKGTLNAILRDAGLTL